jgi:hypothetical protein
MKERQLKLSALEHTRLMVVGKVSVYLVKEIPAFFGGNTDPHNEHLDIEFFCSLRLLRAQLRTDE